MEAAKFSLIFEGSAVENGEIDVGDLAPSLLALGELIQAANHKLNDDKEKLSVKITATKKGSFEAILAVTDNLAPHLSGILDVLSANKDGISAANDVVELIFKTTAATAIPAGGLLALIKWLKGRKPERIKNQNGEVHIHIGDNHFVTNEKVIELAETIEVREQAKKLVSVLQRDGIDSISTRQESNEKLTINKEDMQSFSVPNLEEEVLEDGEREMFLQIDSLSFKEGNKWKVTDGGEPFYAEITDVDFVNKIAIGEISFSKNDYLHCRVRETQTRNSKGTLKKERTIIKVIKHRKGARQLKLL